MSNVKMLVFAVVGLVGLIALAGGDRASATELTCSGGTMCSAVTSLHAESEGKVVFDTPGGTVECNSTLEAKTSNTGGSSETVGTNVEALSFTNCGSDTVIVHQKGTFELHTRTTSADNNGTLTSHLFTVTILHLGIHCLYVTEHTDLGTLTGSASTSGNATLDLSARLPFHGGESGVFCGSSIPWTGSYKFTAPSTLNVD